MKVDETILDWKKDKPAYKGLYFVAIKYGEGAGIYDFITWDGVSWDAEYEGEVIAYVDIQHLKNSLNIAWPESDSGREKKFTPKPSQYDEPWTET